MTKKTIWIFVLLSQYSLLFSQETVLVKEKISKYEKYEYYVLKSDETIKHGSFKEYSGKDLEESGFYKDGKKDSLWNEYYYDGKIRYSTTYSNDKKNGEYLSYIYNGKLSIRGNFTDDVRTGIWEYYDKDGVLDRKFDYEENKLLYFSDKYDLNYTEIKEGDTIHHKLDQPCMYIDGLEELYRQVANFRYPEEARANDIQGKVYISFTIGKDGVPYDYKVVRGLGYGLDEEALRIVKSLPGKWVPPVVNGEAVEIKFTLPIVCKLS